MIPKTDKDEIEIFVIQPHYKDTVTFKKMKEKKIKITEKKFVKENWLRVWMKKTDIAIRGEYTNQKGEVLKSRCTIYNRAGNTYHQIAHSLDELNQALKIGYKDSVGFKTNY